MKAWGLLHSAHFLLDPAKPKDNPEAENASLVGVVNQEQKQQISNNGQVATSVAVTLEAHQPQ